MIFRRIVLPLLALATLALTACSEPPPATPAAPPALETLAPPPADLLTAIDSFRAEGPKGWAFTQTTTGGGKDRVERYNPRLPGPDRWTLLTEKGAPATEEQKQRYRETRPVFDASANLAGQLDRTRVEVVARTAERTTYQFHLVPQGEKDRTALHMRARFTLEHASHTFSRVELFNAEPFKAASSLTIEEARTTLEYSAPAEGRPALPREISMHVSGRRFWFRDFTETVVSRFSEHENVARPATVP
ncbi:MAG: hypothetical protein NTU80_06290 [Verrucomicrobia bacterium]|nr:hypothetical protein [Verrucomicrobiota bacterium]